MTPLPMNTMLEKQTKQEAIEKRNKRRSIVVQDVPPIVPGIILTFLILNNHKNEVA
jgi:hypothetical protein